MKCILTSTANFHHDFAYNVVKDIIKPNMKVICLPFASEIPWQLHGDMTDFVEKHYEPFERFGIKESDFYTVRMTDNIDYIKGVIQSADIIYFSGGFMENITYVLNLLGIKDFITQFRDEKIFIGESAGSLILQDEYMETPNIEDHYKHYRRMEGLGIVKGYELLVHYDKNNSGHVTNFKVISAMNRHSKIVLGISDGGALVINGNRIFYLGDCTK